jgi:hypothetical protein
MNISKEILYSNSRSGETESVFVSIVDKDSEESVKEGVTHEAGELSKEIHEKLDREGNKSFIVLKSSDDFMDMINGEEHKGHIIIAKDPEGNVARHGVSQKAQC